MQGIPAKCKAPKSWKCALRHFTGTASNATQPLCRPCQACPRHVLRGARVPLCCNAATSRTRTLMSFYAGNPCEVEAPEIMDALTRALHRNRVKCSTPSLQAMPGTPASVAATAATPATAVRNRHLLELDCSPQSACSPGPPTGRRLLGWLCAWGARMALTL